MLQSNRMSGSKGREGAVLKSINPSTVAHPCPRLGAGKFIPILRSAEGPPVRVSQPGLLSACGSNRLYIAKVDEVGAAWARKNIAGFERHFQAPF